MTITNPQLSRYRNGGYQVSLYADGTKTREKLSDAPARFAENIDIKITDYCDAGCPMCHESSTRAGLHGNLDYDFLLSIPSGTEVAIGGGNPLSHPGLPRFLRELKELGVIPNITINQIHLTDAVVDQLLDWTEQGMIYGTGISLVRPQADFAARIRRLPHAVLHVINGYHRFAEVMKLGNQGMRVLVLGYKTWGRGVDYHTQNVQALQEDWYENFYALFTAFDVVSFDNLAIEQLNLRRILTDKEWEQFYMGDDGNFTFYLDLVKGQFAQNSFSPKRYDVRPFRDVAQMFNHVRSAQ